MSCSRRRDRLGINTDTAVSEVDAHLAVVPDVTPFSSFGYARDLLGPDAERGASWQRSARAWFICLKPRCVRLR
jgi:hypothetical protein